ncbi:uncharacterized protein LOC124138327 [Haliotis rufescens]|uniref:uncharacterized protein LOC124138327 n=1 Tax=Haliotis rufescens TaxID=6454 RepID=UPI00201E9DA3|nr:uncharacterized protein LOC124138327 [Haliotis rufescens]
MAAQRKMLILVVLCIAVQISHQLIAKQTIDMKCDPTLSKRMDDCPTGYCCVRDEFLPTYVYCKKMGVHNEDCTTRLTESACPCVSGLHCRPNIESATFHSLYGKCHPNTTAHGSITG